MALPKKGLRKITFNSFLYGWSATGNDGYIHLSIAPLMNEGQLLTAIFDYHSEIVDKTQLPDGLYVYHSKQRILITPGIVRQVIEYGLKVGWNPKVKQKVLNLGSIDDKLDLKLE